MSDNSNRGLDWDQDLLDAIRSAARCARSDERGEDPPEDAFPIDAFMQLSAFVAQLARRRPRACKDDTRITPYSERITDEEELSFLSAILYHLNYGHCEVAGAGSALAQLAKKQGNKFSRGFRHALRERSVEFKTLARVRSESAPLGQR